MMVVTMGPAVGPGHLDPVTLDMIDSTNMDAIGANDFHMLFD
ncbi:hypothetical protein EBBID32_36450 [Sphingobium indicum BiD32]|uniref:Uncharacterized protein n=1 Tax=Sphingobium indicum BiD32 TaxID=1301087 RepID=N1MRC4_9SPHN|nr:hypothetical protein EBBID32_36450 [Sphingobium indicum BiD32]